MFDQAKSRRNGRAKGGMNDGQAKAGRLDTLIAVAIAVGMLKGHAAPPVATPKSVTVEQHATPAPKPALRHKAEPSLGY